MLNGSHHNETIVSREALGALQQQCRAELERLYRPAEGHRTVLVCGETACKASRADALCDAFFAAIHRAEIQDRIQVVKTGCFGFCEQGPIVKILPDEIFYVKVSPEDADEIVASHLAENQPVERLIFRDPATGDRQPRAEEMAFFQGQQLVVRQNAGRIGLGNLSHYLACGGGEALAKALFEMTPEGVIDEVTRSGLRGRGGGGFPTGRKWAFTAQAKGTAKRTDLTQKYVVCNADEGDPGAFMDRSILEGDPHSVLEAMAVCGYAIGASKGLMYIRAEYPLAVQSVRRAIAQARQVGLLGERILGSDFSFDVEIRFGAGAFVCGEETALITSMEGKRGEPWVKPPFPADQGFMYCPTTVNNVETLANIPRIILRGADWFSAIGTEGSKGTKVFALAGKINNVGLIEVPMGTTLHQIIFGIGGGIKGGRQFKAVQTGGPSGGCLTGKHLDTPIDYDNLTAAGSMMGSGGMIVMDETDCMVSVAKFYLGFTVDESCGKCAPCRIGNKRLYEILEKITEGKAELEDLEKLRNLAYVIKDTALCGLGQTSPNPVLSTLDNFYEEYVAHVVEKRCPAGRCKSLIRYYIDPELCVGCTVCARNCPVDAISGERRMVPTLDLDKCIRCGVCIRKCKFNAISAR